MMVPVSLFDLFPCRVVPLAEMAEIADQAKRAAIPARIFECNPTVCATTTVFVGARLITVRANLRNSVSG